MSVSGNRETTRRALLGGAGLAVALTVAPAASSARATSAGIEKYWQDRRDAYREFEADEHALDDVDSADPYWERIDAAERSIMDSPDKSARAIELRLWLAWSHVGPSRIPEDISPIVADGDVATLRRMFPDLDCHEKLLLAAILDLRGEDAA